ncbi:putative RNA-directed DNA polymerase [Medicago truncatula]|uniref:Putative RNA-directed DNA polymerase n=1 Tax=Medicago truncatula TaxID=3880 RepID=A0A396JXW7_MEDTR|nr:putative RNA-directed DNA polymerase [Medicago truncatula]
MNPHKAPGEDGYPAIFFQKCWDTVADSIYQFVNQVWVTPSLISSINNTLIVMIPKIDKPEFVSQFRPIALCNVIYKIISKVIVNRIKPLLDGIISPYQSSFIPGRSIHHNIIVAQEMVHSMARMKGNKMFMSIKIDLEKAYDRINWNFVENCLEDCKFPPNLIQIIRDCISSPSYKILWNGDKTDTFTPTRGIRQGDPLSPYLFVICMERLSHIISDRVEAQYWKPMRAGRGFY